MSEPPASGTPVEVPILPAYLVHWNAPDWCASAVESLRRSVGVDVHVTVIDNHSSGAEELQAALGDRARFLGLEQNRGYAGGANVALREWLSEPEGSELCLIGSHDLHVTPVTVARVLEAAAAHPDLGIVAPRLTTPGAHGSKGSVGFRRVLEAIETGGPVVKKNMAWVSGTCMVLRRDCVEQVGGFDERFGSYVEDVDYGLRANDAGWKVGLVLDAEAKGLGTASDAALVLKTSNTILLHAKRGGLGAGTASLVRTAVCAVQAVGRSMAPWRPGEDRLESKRARHQLSRAVCRAVPLLVRYARFRWRRTLFRSDGKHAERASWQEAGHIHVLGSHKLPRAQTQRTSGDPSSTYSG